MLQFILWNYIKYDKIIKLIVLIIKKIGSFILFNNLFNRKHIIHLQKNEQLDKIIKLLELSNNSDSINDKELQLIEIDK